MTYAQDESSRRALGRARVGIALVRRFNNNAQRPRSQAGAGRALEIIETVTCLQCESIDRKLHRKRWAGKITELKMSEGANASPSELAAPSAKCLSANLLC